MKQKQSVLYRMKQSEFQDYQRRVWAMFTPDEDGKPRVPNRFEVATGDALFRAVPEAYGPISHEKFTVVSAATGSGKTHSAVALAAYMASKEGRVTLLESQINQIANVYDTLVKVIAPEWVAIWSTVHRSDRSERDVQKYLSEATESAVKHFEDPPRFSLEECRNARVLLTTHASWRQGLGGGRDLNIAGSDLILIDEDPALQRVFQFTSVEVAKLAYVFKMGKRDGVAGAFDHEAEAVLEAIHDRVAAVEKAEVRRGRLAGVDIVTTEELRVLSAIERETIHQYCYSTQQLDAFQGAMGHADCAQGRRAGSSVLCLVDRAEALLLRLCNRRRPSTEVHHPGRECRVLDTRHVEDDLPGRGCAEADL
jgi:hypothetical protein